MSDAAKAMLYDANKKSLGVTYLLWFFLGGLGGHRFYAGKTGSAIFILILSVIGAFLSIVGIGFILIGIVVLWVIIDAFLIPRWIRNHNMLLATSLTGGATL